MAKPRKVVINTEELTPTVLATVKNKKSGIFAVILIFAFFGAIVYFLPNITIYIDNFLHPKVSSPTAPTVVNNNTASDEEKEEVVKYTYSNNLVITEDDFTLSNFNIINGSLTFRVNNSKNTVLNFDDYNYYLELINSEDTLLERIKLDNLTVSSLASVPFEYKLKDSNIAYLEFREIEVSEYHAYTATSDSNGLGMLECVKDNEVINYYLNNNKLSRITDTFTLNIGDDNYISLVNTYQSLANTYQNINGVTSNITTNDNGIDFITTIDLNINNNVTISKIIYPKDTDAKIMYFEMNARGYICK